MFLPVYGTISISNQRGKENEKAYIVVVDAFDVYIKFRCKNFAIKIPQISK